METGAATAGNDAIDPPTIVREMAERFLELGMLPHTEADLSFTSCRLCVCVCVFLPN